MNKIDEIKARATEKRMQIRRMHWSLDDELLNDIDWLIGQIERKDEALRTMAESPDEWYVGRTPMREYARQALEAL